MNKDISMEGTESGGAPGSGESGEQEEVRHRREMMAAAAERRQHFAPAASPSTRSSASASAPTSTLGLASITSPLSPPTAPLVPVPLPLVQGYPVSVPIIPVVSPPTVPTGVVSLGQLQGALLAATASPAVPISLPFSQTQTGAREENVLLSLDPAMAEQLFEVVFGPAGTPEVLSQWCQQGFRFGSRESGSAMVLVQRQGGPCGVLAPVQALTLKHLLFSSSAFPADPDLNFAPAQCFRALIAALEEAICGCASESGECMVACLLPAFEPQASSMFTFPEDQTVSITDALSLHQQVGVLKCSTALEVRAALMSAWRSLQSGAGALLVLFSLLLSRGLQKVQEDRDDPSVPLVTTPFGHAGQEVVNLLLCHRAVANVFDDSMDLGDGMHLRGIPQEVQVGFLTLLESLHYCKVGDRLKRPHWPIWVVGSESHYSVLFATTTQVQEDPVDEETKERRVRAVFDKRDCSGGGGLVMPEVLPEVLAEMQIQLPDAKINELTGSGVVVWQDLWQAILAQDPAPVTVSTAPPKPREFELIHVNGIEKTNTDPNVSGRAPRVTRLQVFVPPPWSPTQSDKIESSEKINKESMDVPIVKCIRTRWQRASCTWIGETPSLV